MPIKGLTDREAGIEGLPRLGKLRKGAPQEKDDNGKHKKPRDLNYFRVEFEPEYAWLEEIWLDLYGSEPSRFTNVRFPYNDVEAVFPTWLEAWNSSGALLCRTDGETVFTWYDADANHYRSDPKPYREEDYLDSKNKPQTKQIGRLNLLLPDFVAASGALGVFVLTTSSYNDIRTIHDRLSALQAVHGRLSGIPFVLSRVTRKISVPMTNGRGKTDKSLIAIDVDPAFTSSVLLPLLTGGVPALPARSIDYESGEVTYENSDSADEQLKEDETSWYDDGDNAARYATWLEGEKLLTGQDELLTGQHPRSFESGYEACASVRGQLARWNDDETLIERCIEAAGLDAETARAALDVHSLTFVEFLDALAKLAQQPREQQPTVSWYDDPFDRDELEVFLRENYEKSPAEALAAVGKNAWQVYANLDAARADVMRVAGEQLWTVVAYEVRYEQVGGKKVMAFETPEEIRWFKGRTELLKALQRDNFTSWEPVKQWEPGSTYTLPEPVRIAPEHRGDNQEWLAVASLEVAFQDIPF
jgi:hypothetical protein